jgi:hypothetical protein
MEYQAHQFSLFSVEITSNQCASCTEQGEINAN